MAQREEAEKKAILLKLAQRDDELSKEFRPVGPSRQVPIDAGCALYGTPCKFLGRCPPTLSDAMMVQMSPDLLQPWALTHASEDLENAGRIMEEVAQWYAIQVVHVPRC